MRLVPVDFGTPQLTAGDADRGDALEFTPATPTVLSAKPRELTNRPPGRDSLDVSDWPNDFEVHLASSLHRSRRTLAVSGGRASNASPRSAVLPSSTGRRHLHPSGSKMRRTRGRSLRHPH